MPPPSAPPGPNEKQHAWPAEQLAELVHEIVAPMHAPMATHEAAVAPPLPLPPPPPRFAQHTCVALLHLAAPHAVVPVELPFDEPPGAPVPDDEPDARLPSSPDPEPPPSSPGP